ncbi:hypothetical protein T01_9566, partial [Trichinella spiralis]
MQIMIALRCIIVKLMKQRESENADGTKQNKGRQEVNVISCVCCLCLQWL